MIITMYLYTTDKKYAEEKTKEVIDTLAITNVMKITSEPYWKFSDMYVTCAATLGNFYPDDQLLDNIADVWWDHSESIGTSDTTPDNTMKISDLAMITLTIDRPPDYKYNMEGDALPIDWIRLDRMPVDPEAHIRLIRSLGEDVYYFVRKEPSSDNNSSVFKPENLVHRTDNPGSYHNRCLDESSEFGTFFEWYYMNSKALLEEYIRENSRFYNILIIKNESVDFLYYISNYDDQIAVKDYQGDFKEKYRKFIALKSRQFKARKDFVI